MPRAESAACNGSASCVVGLACSLVAMPFMGARIGDYAKLAEALWWAGLGGLCGAVFIYAMLTLTQKVGAGVFVAATVTTSVVTSVAIDHFGALGVEPHPAMLWRIVGVLLMLGGVAWSASSEAVIWKVG